MKVIGKLKHAGVLCVNNANKWPGSAGGGPRSETALVRWQATLQTGNLVSFFERNHTGEGYPRACSVMSLIYVLGLALIWLAPETRQLPD